MKTEKQINYNRAKTWQVGLFSLNNTATNTLMILMMYVSYFATGVAGLSVVVISSLLTTMRMFDAVTDPIIGFIIDKTNTKFGKFRPMIFIGYVIMAISILTLYNTLHLFPDNLKLIGFIGLYGLYIIGYTFQTASTKAGQSCLTNDPAQRPLFSRFDGIFCLILFTFGAQYTSAYLVPKYGGFTLEAMKEFSLTFVILSGIFTVLAIIGIWSKDRVEYFGINADANKVKFRDYVSVLKGNRPLQMLVVSAATDKLAMQTATNSSVMVMLFGIVMGNYAMYGQMSMVTMIPSLILIIYGTKFAAKFGSKKALVTSTWISMVLYMGLFAVLVLGDPTTIALENLNITTILWIVLFCLSKGSASIAGGIVIPMIADCADYETYRSGRFVPGMIGTLFSFVDKIVSSFATTLVGLGVAYVGYTSAMPQAGDPSSPALVAITLALFIGAPMLGWIASLIAMKFYDLDDVKMKEIQEEINKAKMEQLEETV